MTNNRKRGLIALLIASAVTVSGCRETIVSSDATAARTSTVSGEDQLAAKGRTSEGIAVPFKARFFTLGGIDPTDDSCGNPPIFRNVQDGSGQAAHLGRSKVHIVFCNDATDFLDDGQLTEGESVPYDRGIGTFTAANGDELWITISGTVLPSDHSDYDFEFADPFEIVGGTGRFKGATGSGVTDSFVIAEKGRTDHYWYGTLVYDKP